MAIPGREQRIIELSALLRDMEIVAAQNTVPGKESTSALKVLP